MRDSIRLGIMFNIIDTERGQNVDLVPLSMNAHYNNALKNRQRQSFEDAEGNIFQAWCAPPEDIIFGKLMAWREGHSYKHQQDIVDMLRFIYSKLDPDLTEKYNESYVNHKVIALGNETVEFWKELKKIAKERRD